MFKYVFQIRAKRVNQESREETAFLAKREFQVYPESRCVRVCFVAALPS